MKCPKLTLAVFVGGLLIALSAWAANVSSSPSGNGNMTQTKPPLPQLSRAQIQRQAQTMTVKIMSKGFLGSGFLLYKQGNVYTVVTNAHVLRPEKPPYQIQTLDGRIWQAELPKNNPFGNNDLAILKFRSLKTVYPVASVGSSPAVKDEVFAGGFAFAQDGETDKGFAFTSGHISLVLPKALEGGYRLGYTNNIQKGMSGGPLLNRRGEVIGVNGVHAFPLWDAPSVFVDGEKAAPTLHQKIIRLSWAVPIETVVHQGFKKPHPVDSLAQLNQ